MYGLYLSQKRSFLCIAHFEYRRKALFPHFEFFTPAKPWGIFQVQAFQLWNSSHTTERLINDYLSSNGLFETLQFRSKLLQNSKTNVPEAAMGRGHSSRAIVIGRKCTSCLERLWRKIPLNHHIGYRKHIQRAEARVWKEMIWSIWSPTGT